MLLFVLLCVEYDEDIGEGGKNLLYDVLLMLCGC